MRPAIGVDLQAIVDRFRPVYYLHTAERFYPCSFGDVMKQCSLLYTDGGGTLQEIIPFPHLNADTLRGDENALKDAGLTLDPKHIHALSWKRASDVLPDMPAASEFDYTVSQGRNYRFSLRNRDILPGNLQGGMNATPTCFDPAPRQGREKTSYENDFPLFAGAWKGGGAAALAEAHRILNANKAFAFDPNPQYCAVSRRCINHCTYTDLIYTTFFAFNGSIAFMPGIFSHIIDVEVVGVRFSGDEVTTGSTPLRYYFAQHAGFSWYAAADGETMRRKNADGSESDHLVVYLARESHEVYPRAGVWQRIYGLANDLCDQGVLWTPPAKLLDVPSDQAAEDLREQLAQKLKIDDAQSVMLIPRASRNDFPGWYFSVTPAHLPGSEGMPPSNRKKTVLPESGCNSKDLFEDNKRTARAADHSEPGTWIDEGVPARLDVVLAPGPEVVPLPPSTGTSVAKISCFDWSQSPGSQLLENIGQLADKIMPAVRDKWVPDPYDYDGGEKPVFSMHRRDERDKSWKFLKRKLTAWDVYYDATATIHSRDSLKKAHPGDAEKFPQYPGGVHIEGLRHFKVRHITPSSTPHTFKVVIGLEHGKQVTVRINFEILLRLHAFILKAIDETVEVQPHLLLDFNFTELDAEIDFTLHAPLAICNENMVGYCLDDEGHRADGPLTGWFVPNVHWAHTGAEVFEGATNCERYCTQGLPPDSVFSRADFTSVMQASVSGFTVHGDPTYDVSGIVPGRFRLGGKEYRDAKISEIPGLENFIKTGRFNKFRKDLGFKYRDPADWVLSELLEKIPRIVAVEQALEALKNEKGLLDAINARIRDYLDHPVDFSQLA